ncbi:hypothetical protein J3R82DRAFT_1243 [Butyriboletus roseoflavus]|nr:hypothetical protein J3R82DRAFT_1243 [Butyriboletus roseoflavus]
MANFTARLEPFLLISKSAKGAAAAKLVQDATSAPGVFVFAELLELANIQEARLVVAPRCFSKHKDSLPPLNPAQITKLKYLTIVTLATERHILPYSLLLQELHVASIRELEDLIIDAIYLDILRGKLDQKEQQLEIEYTMGRDLEPGKLEKLLEALQNWATTTATVLSELDQKLMETATYDATVQAENEEHEKTYQANLKDVQERQKDGKGGRRMQLSQNSVDSMDVDEPLSDGMKLRNRKPATDTALKVSQRKRNRV